MLTRRRVLAAAIETTHGTAEAITAADGGILVIDPKIDTNIAMESRKVIVPSLSNISDIPGTQSAVLTFQAELKGAGAAYSATVKPAIGKYLRACGFGEVIDTTAGLETATYSPISDSIPTLTMWLFEDGVVKKMKGCAGTAKVSVEVGKPAYIDFTFTGIWDGVADAALITPTFEMTVPPVLLSAAFSLDAYSAKISKLDIDVANAVALREDISTSTGFSFAEVTSRLPVGSFDPEMTNVATYNWFGKWLAGGTGALSASIGATQYNKYAITAPAVQYTKIAEGDRNGVFINDVTIKLNQSANAGNDEIQLVFS